MAKRRSWRNGNKTISNTTMVPNNRLPEVVVKGVSEKVMNDFMPIVQERLKARLPEFRMHTGGELEGSFNWKVRPSGEGVTGELRFRFYGRFVDMGVGKGMTLAEQQTGHAATSSRVGFRAGRKPKPWFMPQYLYEIERLQEIIAEEMQQIALEAGTPPEQIIIITI